MYNVSCKSRGKIQEVDVPACYHIPLLHTLTRARDAIFCGCVCVSLSPYLRGLYRTHNLVKLDPFHLNRLMRRGLGSFVYRATGLATHILYPRAAGPPRSRCSCVTCRLRCSGRARTAVSANAGARTSEGLGPGASRSGGGAPRSPRAPQQKGSPLCCQPPGRSARAGAWVSCGS